MNPTDPQTPPVPVTTDPAQTPAAVPVGPRAKEISSQTASLDTLPEAASAVPAESEAQTKNTEVAPMGGGAESERQKELEPEVEKVVEKIKNTERQRPAETVVVSETAPATPPNTVAQPVVVLPLTQDGMKAAKGKNEQYSARWLYEWCVRQVQKFSKTIIVYRKKSTDET